MKVKLIIILIILLLVVVFASGCIPVMEKLGLVNPANEEQLSPEKGGPPDGLVKVLIGFKEKPGAAQQAMVKGVGGKIKYTYHIVDAIAASIPEKAIEALQNNPNVRYVEPDGQVYALDDELNDSWGVQHIGAGFVHESGNRGAGVNIAIIDSGIYHTHEDLSVNYQGGFDFVNSVDVNEDGDYDDDGDTFDDDPMDDNGHGTHVAGIVAAEDNGFGVVGVAPEANLYALKVLNEKGIGDFSDVIAALEWCMDKDIQITNNSYGSSGEPDQSLRDAFDNSASDGVLHVAAAGNNGNPPARGDNVGYPAAYDSVIAVAATDQNDVRARWSSTGPAVELAAPGVSINSTYIGGGYATLSGTSMASPHVAGVAALVIASGITDVSDVRNKLKDTADDLGDEGWDWLYGNGLVDAAEAADVDTPLPNESPTVSITNPADGSTFDSGAIIPFEGTASDLEDKDGDLTASLVWTSSIDGSIGTGGSFDNILNDGNHTITAVVTDSGDETGSASISITVGTSSNIMHVSDIIFSAKKAGINLFLYTTVDVSLKDNGAVDGARVTMTLTDETSSWNYSSDTGSDGTVKFTLKAQPGHYTATITDVSHTEYDWDGGVTTKNCELDENGNIIQW